MKDDYEEYEDIEIYAEGLEEKPFATYRTKAYPSEEKIMRSHE